MKSIQFLIQKDDLIFPTFFLGWKLLLSNGFERYYVTDVKNKHPLEIPTVQFWEFLR
jgi:hypothetical protein